MTVLVLLGLTVVGFLILLDRKDRRAHEERQADRLERAAMAQRIQAPQLAVIEHAQGSVQDSDGLPPTDEQLAEQQEHAAAMAQLAEMERDYAGRQL